MNGIGGEPAVRAPHFQLDWPPVLYCPRTPEAVHGSGVRANSRFHQCASVFGVVRGIGYRLATRVGSTGASSACHHCHRLHPHVARTTWTSLMTRYSTARKE